MKISLEGLSAIKAREGLALKAYKCPAGVWTVGYGHTGKDVHPYYTISRDDAIALLMRDISAPERFLNDLDYPYTQNQYDALVSFIFNLGITKFKKSTMLKYLRCHADPEKIAGEFGKWIWITVTEQRKQKDGTIKEVKVKVKSKGLIRRRESEQKQFLGIR